MRQTLLGWDNFLRGRLSKRWQEAFNQEFLSRNIRANGLQWAGGVITAVLDYSHSLWKYRCAFLYGRSKLEAEQKILDELHGKVTCAYADYEKDPFIIRQDYRRLFAIPLDRRLKQDRDCLQCFISTFNLAVKERKEFLAIQSEKAQRFFLPRSLPNTVHIPSCSASSQISDMTDTCGSLSIQSSISLDNLDTQPWESELPLDSVSLPQPGLLELSSSSTFQSFNCSSDSSSVSMDSVDCSSQSMSSSERTAYRVVDL
jgi:hypothetical protein